MVKNAYSSWVAIGVRPKKLDKIKSHQHLIDLSLGSKVTALFAVWTDTQTHIYLPCLYRFVCVGVMRTMNTAKFYQFTLWRIKIWMKQRVIFWLTLVNLKVAETGILFSMQSNDSKYSYLADFFVGCCWCSIVSMEKKLATEASFCDAILFSPIFPTPTIQLNTSVHDSLCYQPTMVIHNFS